MKIGPKKKVQELKKQLQLIDNYRSQNKDIFINIDDDDLMIGRKGCAGGYSIFSIDDKGNIYPCTYVVGNKDFIINNIFENTDIELKYTSSEEVSRNCCIGCKYYKCCKSGSCLYANYKMSGKYGTPSSNFCEYQKILYSLRGV